MFSNYEDAPVSVKIRYFEVKVKLLGQIYFSQQPREKATKDVDFHLVEVRTNNFLCFTSSAGIVGIPSTST